MTIAQRHAVPCAAMVKENLRGRSIIPSSAEVVARGQTFGEANTIGWARQLSTIVEGVRGAYC
jgi:hypothetical protein